jgi:hypothetical protein
MAISILRQFLSRTVELAAVNNRRAQRLTVLRVSKIQVFGLRYLGRCRKFAAATQLDHHMMQLSAGAAGKAARRHADRRPRPQLSSSFAGVGSSSSSSWHRQHSSAQYKDVLDHGVVSWRGAVAEIGNTDVVLAALTSSAGSC